MHRVYLSEADREELKRRSHEPGVKPRLRDRLEMVRLSDAGWSIPKIAEHLRYNVKRVRHWIREFLGGGFDALASKPLPGKQSLLTPELLGAIRERIAKGDRTWTAQQIADWLDEEHHVRLSADRLGRHLRRARLSYKRTSRSLKHKQDPEDVATKSAQLQALEKGAMLDRRMCVT